MFFFALENEKDILFEKTYLVNEYFRLGMSHTL